MKTCSKCSVTKSLSDFYLSGRTDGSRFASCKECTKRRVRERYAQTRDERSAYEPAEDIAWAKERRRAREAEAAKAGVR